MGLIKVKKIIVLIALAVLLISALFYYISVLRQFAGGIGTRNHPYRIETVEQLDWVRNHLKAHFVLVNDLDMRRMAFKEKTYHGDSGWIPIGYDSLLRWDSPAANKPNFSKKKFSGSFNGCGHTIKNFSTHHFSESTTGLFTIIDSCACVESLSIVATEVQGWSRVGAIAGLNYGIISNCQVEGEIFGKRGFVGALVGENYGTIIHSSSINGTIPFNQHYEGDRYGLGPVGGLVGFNGGKLDGCFSQNTVYGGIKVGGLVGIADRNSIIQNCHADGKINGYATSVGGLVGENAGTITNCYSKIQYSGSFDTLGAFVGANAGTITNCYSQGASVGNYDENTRFVGGFAGVNKCALRKCFSTVRTISGRSAVGGLVGYNEGCIDQCYSTGNVNGNGVLGGFIGECNGTVNACFSTGNVNGIYDNVGGFIGNNNNSNINMVYSIGKVVGGQERVGGLIGYSAPQKNKYENYEYKYSNCFYDRISSGIAVSQGGTVSTTREMMQASTYIKAGWDLDTLWLLHNLVNQGLPYLRAFTIMPLSCDEDGAPLDAFFADDIRIRRVEASSSLQGESGYHPDFIRDGKLSTAWVEGSSGDGEGEWIEISFGKPENITGIIIVNGYIKSEELYRANNRIKDLNIWASRETDTLVNDVTLSDRSFQGGQKAVGELLPGFKDVKKCRFKIKSVYKGSRYHDTCISEIIFLVGK